MSWQGVRELLKLEGPKSSHPPKLPPSKAAAIAIAALLALAACGRDGFSAAPRPEQTPEDMAPDPFAGPDEGADLRLTAPALVVESGPDETWDVQLQALLSVDEGFLAVWHQNISGRVQLRAGFVGPEKSLSLSAGRYPKRCQKASSCQNSKPTVNRQLHVHRYPCYLCFCSWNKKSFFFIFRGNIEKAQKSSFEYPSTSQSNSN